MLPKSVETSKRCFSTDESRGWSNDKTMHRIAPRIFDGEILVFHFDAYLQLLVRQQNRIVALWANPHSAAIPVFSFSKPIHRPLTRSPKSLRQQKTKLICIRTLGGPLSPLLLREAVGAFLMTNGADAKLTQRTELGSAESCSNQRERVTAFEADRLKPTAAELLQFCFGRDQTGKVNPSLLPG